MAPNRRTTWPKNFLRTFEACSGVFNETYVLLNILPEDFYTLVEPIRLVEGRDARTAGTSLDLTGVAKTKPKQMNSAPGLVSGPLRPLPISQERIENRRDLGRRGEDG